MTIKMKLITVSILLLTIPLIILGATSYQKSGKSLDELGATNLKNNVETIIVLIEAMNIEVEKGDLSLEEAQTRVKDLVLGEQDSEGNRTMDSNIDLGENGFVFFLNNEGIQVAAKNLEGADFWDAEDAEGFKFVQAIIETGNDGGGLTYYDWPLPDNEDINAPNVTYAKTDPHWGWTINTGAYMMDFNKPAKEVLNVTLMIIAGVLIVGIAIIWIFANSISRPINTVIKQLNYLADGDLTQEHIEVRSSDEIGQLATAMNGMQTKLRNMITNVLSASGVITNQSSELRVSADEVREGSEQVATIMEELATGSESQATHAGNLSAKMDGFISQVEKTNENSAHIESVSSTVLVMTNEGSQLMESSTKQMAMIDSIVHEAVQKVEGLDRHAQEISELVSVIQGIADQTNLLALNAAIEAARAGEHGQGFAVVADEVRKLAEQSSVSVTDITGIVSNIQSESNAVAVSLQDGYKEVEQGTSQIIITGETFTRISEAVTEMVGRIKDVSNNLSEISKDSQEMNASIEEIAAITEESAAGVEETSASSLESSSAMEEVAESSSELSRLAEELNEVVREFKI